VSWKDLYVQTIGRSEAEENELLQLALRAVNDNSSPGLRKEVGTGGPRLYAMCYALDEYRVPVPPGQLQDP
jgi:hypothetical protein